MRKEEEIIISFLVTMTYIFKALQVQMPVQSHSQGSHPHQTHTTLYFMRLFHPLFPHPAAFHKTCLKDKTKVMKNVL